MYTLGTESGAMSAVDRFYAALPVVAWQSVARRALI